MLSDILADLPDKIYEDGGTEIKHPPYIAPVEGGDPEVIQCVRQISKGNQDNAILMGYGGLSNIELFAAGQYSAALLVDINRGQIDFWNDFINRIRQYEGVQSLVDSYRGEAHSEVCDYANSADGLSFLKNQDSYSFVRSAVLEGDVVAVSLSLFDVARHAQLKRLLDDAGIKIGLLHVANIIGAINGSKGFWSEQVSTNAKSEANQNISNLTDDSTYILDSSELMPVNELPSSVATMSEVCSVFVRAPHYLGRSAEKSGSLVNRT